MRNKRILVAALNWGLGHATRCIPIIRELEKFECEVIIASDGPALKLLQKEFPRSRFEELPSYNIIYTRKGSRLKWKLLLAYPVILKTIKAEKAITEKLVEKYDLTGIISDNRWGVRSDQLKKNIFLTHQLTVLSGSTTFLSTYIQQRYIDKFDECWIPDSPEKKNLSGKLGHLKHNPENIKYTGVLSRFQKQKLLKKFEYLILLSGPEPQRSMLESILLQEFKDTTSKVLFIRGVFSEEQLPNKNPNLTIKNYSYGRLLEKAINSSNFVIARSGYTTLMDLSKLEKKAFFIPTPGQEEQQYLAKRIKSLDMAPYCQQNEFSVSKLKEIETYKGLSDLGDHTILRDRLAFFESE